MVFAAISGPVVGENGLEADPVLDVQQVDALERSKHHAQALQVVHHLRPDEPGAGVEHGHQEIAPLDAHDQVLAQVVAVEVAQLPRPGLDDLTLGLLHGLGQPVQGRGVW